MRPLQAEFCDEHEFSYNPNIAMIQLWGLIRLWICYFQIITWFSFMLSRLLYASTFVFVVKMWNFLLLKMQNVYMLQIWNFHILIQDFLPLTSRPWAFSLQSFELLESQSFLARQTFKIRCYDTTIEHEICWFLYIARPTYFDFF